MREEAADFCGGVQGRIRLAANTSAVTQFLPAKLASFLTTYPKIQISLRELTSQRTVEAIRSGSVDLGIFIEGEPQADLEVWPCQTDRLCVVVPSGHPLAVEPQVRSSDVLEFPFVGLKRSSSLTCLLRAHAGGGLRLRVTVRSFDAMCRMVQAGLGIGILPEESVRPHAASMELSTVSLSDPWAARKIVIGARSMEDLNIPSSNLLGHLLNAEGA